MDFIKGAAKAVAAAAGPLVVTLVNHLADVVEAQAAGIGSAIVTALLVYVVPNRS
jgi:hypothetical protein